MDTNILDINLVKETFSGRYEDITYLDKGGMSFVYKARHVGLNRVVAIKVLNPENNSDWDLVNRFYQEIKIGATLNHTNILKIHYGDQIDGLHFLEMDHLEGETLFQIIQRKGQLDEGEAVAYIKPVVSALTHMHGHGIVHRDIKTANVFIDRKKGAILTDFGISYYINNPASIPENDIIGTPEYMSPEHASRRMLPDERSDLYGIGVVLFEAMTGNVPFKGETLHDTLNQVIFNPPPSLIDFQISISDYMDRIIMRLLAKHAEDRYSSSWELYDDLDEIDTPTITKGLWKQIIEFFNSREQYLELPYYLRFASYNTNDSFIPLYGKNLGNNQISCIVGRSTPGGVIPDVDIQEVTISRQHVEIVLINGQLGVRHLYSNNRTYLNGENISAGVIYPLEIGDCLILGGLEFELISSR